MPRFRLLPRRRLTVREWWSYLGSFGDDCFDDDRWSADAPSASASR